MAGPLATAFRDAGCGGQHSAPCDATSFAPLALVLPGSRSGGHAFLLLPFPALPMSCISCEKVNVTRCEWGRELIRSRLSISDSMTCDEVVGERGERSGSEGGRADERDRECGGL